MLRFIQIILLTVILFNAATAQKLEVARHEIPLTSKSQQCAFVTLNNHGILTVAETSITNNKDTTIWNFAILDTNLIELSSINVPIDASLQLNSTTASDEFVATIFAATKRSDSTQVNVVLYKRDNKTFSGFTTSFPPNISLLPAVASQQTLLLAYNGNNGGSSISFFDMNSGDVRHENAQNNNHLIQSVEVSQGSKRFVVTSKEFEDRHLSATNFWVFGTDGKMVNRYTYPNNNGATIGRSCCIGNDSTFNVFATIERIGNTKTSAKNFADSFDKESIGIIWINFNDKGTQTKVYQFKNIPDIDKALTPSNRLRVKQRQASQNDTTNENRGEIAFQLLKPNLIHNNDTNIMALEAFIPIYHTETRMEYGYFGSIPTTYTVFDGYDFYAQLVFAFKNNGEMLWHNHCNYDNPVDESLYRHTSEAVCNGETLLTSASNNTLIYSVISNNGTKLLENEIEVLPFMRQNDILESEFSANTRQWYGNNFIVSGKQILRNRMMRKSNRFVFFLQKIQYE